MLKAAEETVETLPENPKPKINLFVYIFLGATIIIVAATLVIIVLLTKNKNNEENDLKYNVTTIPLPEDILIDDGHYLFDGNIFICYKRSTTNFTYFEVISDDGKNLKELYGEEFIVSPLANGICLIPFRDGKNIYLGDFVFECDDTNKTISSCEKGVLIPVKYPEEVVNNSYNYKTWSEMVVAPDNIHVAWTSLNIACGAVNFLGKFNRVENNGNISYEIIDSKIISTIDFLEQDRTNSSLFKVKQKEEEKLNNL